MIKFHNDHKYPVLLFLLLCHDSPVPHLTYVLQKIKSNPQTEFDLQCIWWRWRELNSRPNNEHKPLLRAPVYFIFSQNGINKQNFILQVDFISK